MGAHSKRTKHFKDLDARQKAAAISAMAINLGNAIEHRIEHAPIAARPDIKAKAVKQLEKLALRIDRL